MPPANVFVLGIDDRNLSILEGLAEAADIRFHALLHRDELLELDQLDLPARLADARRILRDFDGRVDGVVGYWDFPVSTLLPVLCRELELPGPTLEGVLKCEHKYWSRLEQAEAIDEMPAFALVRLEDDAQPPDDIPFPFWLKPVKSVSSQLAFKVESEDDFRRALREIEARIDEFSEPFDLILEQAQLPPQIEEIGGRACIAEEAATGRQFTVEGYSVDDEPRVYGVVESVLYPGTSNFLRYEYPAPIPSEIDDRLVRASEQVMRQIGVGSGSFNIEYFWDEDTDRIRLLEINPRLSQSHAEIIELVDGTSHFHAMVQLALGREPRMPHREGKYAVAAKFFPRVFEDGVVTHAPGTEDIDRVIRDIPGVVTVVPSIEQDVRLSELPHQDPYSYALGEIVIGADDSEQLDARHDACLDALGLVIEREGAGGA
jgi:hypothetical protein